ncbi:hypothetical protein AS9A_3309 [Hoyosella subflava DQS3-9A1]|uniref:Uncharacterized protein n=1 Tax=Hoyosella subflava (strain DSM 45089 / JCM 17490 / NBRC 109087 / DQS3-9A1) TaxID=443218 RepID=F6EP91_HOYSD|nr:hypothetical protein AS9A_3309 [Hoyosella subflava DQS3-9A1]
MLTMIMAAHYGRGMTSFVCRTTGTLGKPENQLGGSRLTT